MDKRTNRDELIARVTDLKRTEKELQESEQRYRALAETSPDAIIVHRQNEFLYANPAALNLYGAESFAQLAERRVFDFLCTESEDETQAILQDLRDGRELPHREARLVRLDGEEVAIESFGAYITYGESRAVQVILRDISERKRTENAMIEANANLERKVQERTAELARRAAQLRALAGELTLTEQRERKRLAGVLHDHIQQLLVAAKFRTAVLSKGLDAPERQSALEIEELINECIGASRSLTAELSPPILHEGGLTAGLEWLAKRMKIRQGLTVGLEMQEVGFLPEDLKVLLFECIRELLFNVVKHARTDSAGVELRHADNRLNVVIFDEGIGFDPDAIPPAGESGGGFGLFSIRERLELFGGDFRIKSTPGMGSRISISVPASGSANAREPRRFTAAESESAHVTAGVKDRRIRIVLADDHKIMREGIATLISNQPDIEIIGEAGDGQETVELAARLLPDVILMDVSMPKINGIEATRIIHDDYPQIRIIGLSMYEEAERSKAMRDAGASDYVTKSGPALDLVRAIRSSFGQKAGGAFQGTGYGL